MVKPPQPPSLPPPEPSFERQLASLFGESLFGSWLASNQYQGAASPKRKRGSPLKRLALLTLILCVGAGTTWLVRAGLARRTDEARAHLALSLATFLKEGELDRVAQFLALLRAPNASLDVHDPHLDLMIRGEAALYRYQDADPERLGRIKPFLALAGTRAVSEQRVLASLVVASRQERADRLSEFEPIRPSFDQDPEFHYLLATALEHKGDSKAATQAWDRSSELGPLWLGHRYEQAWFAYRQKKPETVGKLVAGLVRVAPAAAWTRLASERFAGAQPAEPSVTPASLPAPPAPAVELFHQHLAAALAEARAGDEVVARRRLARAIDVVGGQAPFVFDAFDWLMEARASGLARELTGFEGWPLHSPLADFRVARLAQPEPMPAESPPAAAVPQSNPSKHIKKPSRTKAKTKAKTRRRK